MGNKGKIQREIIGIDASAPGGINTAAVFGAGSLRGLTTTNETFPFKKGVVVEVINDLYEFNLLLGPEGKYVDKVENIEVASQAPRNSLLIAPHGDASDDTLLVCIPFFQSHIMMPAKIGETVWWLPGPSHPYWFSRVSSTDQIEDVNYTHHEQELITPMPLGEDAKEKLDKQEGKEKKFVAERNFGIGGENGGLAYVHLDYSPGNLSNQSLYTNISEPVPRWTPRVGDLVLQGSNNTLISLGTDRGFVKSDEGSVFDFSNATEDINPNTGTIDIVVGRGMLEPDPGPSTDSSDGEDPERTKPRTAKTKEGDVITDKTFDHNDLEPNRAEGDPDFHTDLSRIYVTMESEIDKKLEIKDEYNDPIAGSIDDKQGPAIALKSNEIRIVSREDGSVRILKEKGDGKSASITMMPDGSIHISGDKIYIGQPGGGGEGSNGSEPYILHSYLKDWCNKLHAELDAYCTTVIGHTTPGYGVPSPQLTSAASTLKANLTAVKQIINNFPSGRIYGE